jgi:hypothetical protein
MMKSRVCFFILILTVIPGVFSLPLEELVPSHAAKLRQGTEPVIETQLRNPALRLLPADDNLRQAVSSIMSSLGPSVLVETLYLYNKPESARTNANTRNNAQRTGIYNQLLAISTLEGIQYYSASRSAMRTFFEISYVIDAPGTKNRQIDPVHQTPPASLSVYARQKDLTFGDNVYIYHYTVTDSCIYFVQEKVTALSYGIVPVVGRNNLRTVLAVFDCGDSLLIYVCFMAKAASVPGMGDRIGNSFSNRAEAIKNWFANRANIVYNN